MLCVLNNIDYAFKGSESNKAFKLPHLSVQKGEHSLILGPSGCGKSTLLNLLAGFIKPCQGEMTILNQDMKKLSSLQKDRFRAENMGIIFQQFNLLPFADIYTNIALALRFCPLRRKKVNNIKAEIQYLLKELDFKGESWPKQKALNLSVGQQQRIAAARALIGGPQIILADEPTSALDEQTTARFMALIFHVAKQQNSTLIMVSHNSQLKPYFERIIHLDKIAEITPC